MDDFSSITVSGCNIVPMVSTKNLGITFDESLNFYQHINRFVRSCSYHMRNFVIRKFLNMDNVAFIFYMSRLKLITATPYLNTFHCICRGNGNP